MSITAIIEGIKYQPIIIQKNLKTINLEDFNVNTAPGSCVIKDGFKEFALSKWVSPKRSRSSPYARVYDTISRNKRITIIPIIKDEGIDGDRDFIQWDTISLMSLLEVYVIFGYYNEANKNTKYPNKITKQKFDNDFIVSKIRELSIYQSSALHWNLKELREALPIIIQRQLEAYSRIAIQTGVSFKSFQTFETFKRQLETDVNLFMESSRRKAQQAQSREIVTIHGREYLETLTKASITISNYLGGKYFFTVDEVVVSNEDIFLIESKHSVRSLFPSIGHIKDGLLKMILYSNLSQVYEYTNIFNSKPVLKLTSLQIKGSIDSNSHQKVIADFYNINKASVSSKLFLGQLFQESIKNNFLVQICGQL